jgi:hypothetical protein
VHSECPARFNPRDGFAIEDDVPGQRGVGAIEVLVSGTKERSWDEQMKPIGRAWRLPCWFWRFDDCEFVVGTNSSRIVSQTLEVDLELPAEL